MVRHGSMILVVSLLFLPGCAEHSVTERDIQTSSLPELPVAVANNAVAAVDTVRGQYLVSFSGLSIEKKWNSATAHTFVLEPGAKAWQQAGDVPGLHGRLASIAVAVGNQAYVFGGYTVSENHDEVSLPLVHSFDPVLLSFTRLADMPVPVDDAMALVYEERYIYLISGWHDTANVNLVQRYDTVEDTWVQATAYPGAPVFGHSGGIVGNELVVCGGVEIKTYAKKPRKFVMNDQCFAGTVRSDNARRIDWRTIDPLPGVARYRMAAAGVGSLGGVLFVGGSDNPYNYDGVGYNGVPSEPINAVWLYELESSKWRHLGSQAEATMDHRGLLETHEGLVTAGGMLSGQRVTKKVTAFRLQREGVR